MSAQPTLTLLNRIEKEEDVVYGLSETFGVLRSFNQALTNRVGQARFIIANTTIWDAMLAKRDLLIINFASWVRGLAQRGGLFAQLRAHHLRDLRNAWEDKFKPSGLMEKDVLRKISTDNRRVRLERRFPAAVARGHIVPEDVEAFKDAIWDKLVPVVKDRDSFRAHRYDGEPKADAKALGLNDLEPLLIAAQEMINDLRLVADFSTFGYPSVTTIEPTTEAEDLVDLLLFHDVLGMAIRTGANELLHDHAGVYWWQVREVFFEELRRVHGARPDASLNDRDIVEAAGEATLAKLKPVKT
jgi:hypothetical protein